MQNKRKIEKSCKWPKREEQKILLAPKPPDPLKSSSGEKAVQKAGFVLFQVLDLEARNHGLENLLSIDFEKAEPVYPQIDIL
jgi:hypothetical protein